MVFNLTLQNYRDNESDEEKNSAPIYNNRITLTMSSRNNKLVSKNDTSKQLFTAENDSSKISTSTSVVVNEHSTVNVPTRKDISTEATTIEDVSGEPSVKNAGLPSTDNPIISLLQNSTDDDNNQIYNSTVHGSKNNETGSSEEDKLLLQTDHIAHDNSYDQQIKNRHPEKIKHEELIKLDYLHYNKLTPDYFFLKNYSKNWLLFFGNLSTIKVATDNLNKKINNCREEGIEANDLDRIGEKSQILSEKQRFVNGSGKLIRTFYKVLGEANAAKTKEPFANKKTRIIKLNTIVSPENSEDYFWVNSTGSELLASEISDDKLGNGTSLETDYENKTGPVKTGGVSTPVNYNVGENEQKVAFETANKFSASSSDSALDVKILNETKDGSNEENFKKYENYSVAVEISVNFTTPLTTATTYPSPKNPASKVTNYNRRNMTKDEEETKVVKQNKNYDINLVSLIEEENSPFEAVTEAKLPDAPHEQTEVDSIQSTTAGTIISHTITDEVETTTNSEVRYVAEAKNGIEEFNNNKSDEQQLLKSNPESNDMVSKDQHEGSGEESLLVTISENETRNDLGSGELYSSSEENGGYTGKTVMEIDSTAMPGKELLLMKTRIEGTVNTVMFNKLNTTENTLNNDQSSNVKRTKNDTDDLAKSTSDKGR